MLPLASVVAVAKTVPSDIVVAPERSSNVKVWPVAGAWLLTFLTTAACPVWSELCVVTVIVPSVASVRNVTEFDGLNVGVPNTNPVGGVGKVSLIVQVIGSK